MTHSRAASCYSMDFYHCVLSHRHDCSNVQNTFALKIPASFQLIWINFWVCDHWISGEGYLSFIRNCQAIFQSASIILYFHQQGPIALEHQWQLLVLVCLALWAVGWGSILMGMK